MLQKIIFDRRICCGGHHPFGGDHPFNNPVTAILGLMRFRTVNSVAQNKKTIRRCCIHEAALRSVLERENVIIRSMLSLFFADFNFIPNLWD